MWWRRRLERPTYNLAAVYAKETSKGAPKRSIQGIDDNAGYARDWIEMAHGTVKFGWPEGSLHDIGCSQPAETPGRCWMQGDPSVNRLANVALG